MAEGRHLENRCGITSPLSRCGWSNLMKFGKPTANKSLHASDAQGRISISTDRCSKIIDE